MLRYKGYSLIKPSKIQIKRIEKVIIENIGSVFHDMALNKIVENNFKTDLFYFVDDPDHINCFSPVHILKNKYGFNRYYFSPLGDIPYAGFAGKASIDFKDLTVGFFESIKYSGFPYTNDLIHKTNGVLHNGETNMVDLALDENAIFDTIIHSKRRNMIRKAGKSGISTKCFYTEEGLRFFWPILEELHKKLGYKNYTYEYYNKILKAYSDKKQAFILMAFKEQNPISGIFVLGNQNYMHYYKGAGVFGVKNEGQGELLQWEAIKISKSLGAKYYDLCNLEKEKLPAIYRFKTGISKHIVPYYKYNKNNFGYKILSKI